MKTCVFGGSMSILVNGSPTEEVNIQTGLKRATIWLHSLFSWWWKVLVV